MLINQIKLTKTNIGKSTRTSGDAFRITLTYKGKRCGYIFNDNYYNRSTKEEIIESLLIDSEAYNTSRDYKDFCDSFGYDLDDKETCEIYKACQKQAKKVNRLFTLEEMNALYEDINKYYQNN